MSEGIAEFTHIENAFGTVTDRRVIYFRSKGWFSGGSKEVVSLHRIASVRLEISRQFFLGIPLMMGLSLQADHGVLSVVALVAIVFAALLLWGSPTVVMNAAGHGRNVEKGWPWQCTEAMAFVETLRVRLVHDKTAKSPLRRH
jgi:hypothetical protein